MKNKIIISSILTIALCLSLITGSTFALFETQKQVNLAVTSGKLEVVATTGDLESFSRDTENNVVTVDGKTVATFANGGTATLEGGHLTIDKITPGDKFVFFITVDIASDIAMKHKVTWTVEGDLAQYLTATAQRVELNDDGSYTVVDTDVNTAGWENWTASEATTLVYRIEVGMDITVGNEAQNKTATMDFMFQAVQANADTQ